MPHKCPTQYERDDFICKLKSTANEILQRQNLRGEQLIFFKSHQKTKNCTTKSRI